MLLFSPYIPKYLKAEEKELGEKYLNIGFEEALKAEDVQMQLLLL